MKETKDYFIRNDLPESLNRENVKEQAQLADTILHGFDDKILVVLIYPAIDNLPSDLVDALAIQLHCDFYDSRLPLEIRRKLVKTSIAWHRIKGTPAAVEMLLQTLYQDAHVSEWFEYGGRPYFFRVEVDISNTEEGANPDTMAQVKRVIELAKNVRSWLDLLEFQIHIKEELEITEDRWWIVHIVNSAKELYPWRGRFFNTSWTFVPHVTFDGTWSLDGEYRFDDVPVGAEDAAEKRFAFDGDWWFDGTSRFGYSISRKVLWGTCEPDELTICSRSAIKEQYPVQLPFDVMPPFDAGWTFGARDGPQETDFTVEVTPVLLEHLDPQDKFITIIRPILRDIYPLARIRSFDGTWYFREVIPYDGLWQLGEDPGYRYQDNRFEPWKDLPVSFFGESNETIETIYEEVNSRFDGSWAFAGNVRFGKPLQVPRVVTVEGTPYEGQLYDGSWQFFGLHDADAFWDEDSQECFRILDDEPETEALQVQEESLLQTGADFAESILRCPAFDGSWLYEGIKLLGTSKASFEALPAFGEGRRFDNSWAFEMCSRIFDGSWSLGEDPLHFDGAWHFGGEMYFATNDIPEEAEANVNACITERLEHYAYFGTEASAFDGLWEFGGSDGLQEPETTLQIATALADAEEPQEEAAVSIAVSFREELPSAPVTPFDGGWAFAGQRPFDGNWHFAEGQTFGEPEDGCPVFRQEMEAEYLQVDDEPHQNFSESIHRANTFNGSLTFDSDWSFGEREGMSEGLAVSITSVLRFDDTWAFDDEARKIDGTWNLGDEDYAFSENISPRNRYDGSWNFDSMNTRIRFERRWRSFGSITFAA